MKNFFKGIIVGLGGIAPGLSGSVLLIIFGLYQKTLYALGNLFSDFKKHIRFLLPLLAGMGLGVLLFSKGLNYLLEYHEVPTRFAFLGLILGTVPMLFREVKKNGFSGKYYAVMALAAAFGVWMFLANPDGGLPQIENPNLLQSVVLGVAVVTTAIVPGVDPAVLLSTLGLYEAYVRALATVDLHVLLPMLIGVAVGAVVISWLMTALFNRFYTLTFSIIFGIFLTMIPNMLTENCVLRFDFISAVSVFAMVLGFAVSWYLGDLENNRARLKKWLHCSGGRDTSC